MDASASQITKLSSNPNALLIPKVREDEEILCCGGCGCYGMSGEFLSSDACSSVCQVVIRNTPYLELKILILGFRSFEFA